MLQQGIGKGQKKKKSNMPIFSMAILVKFSFLTASENHSRTAVSRLSTF